MGGTWVARRVGTYIARLWLRALTHVTLLNGIQRVLRHVR